MGWSPTITILMEVIGVSEDFEVRGSVAGVGRSLAVFVVVSSWSCL